MSKRLADIPWIQVVEYSNQRLMMNQTVLRMYLLLLTVVLGVVFSLWPRLSRPSIRWSVLRFMVVLGAGLSLAAFGFHSAGRIDDLKIDDQFASILETHPGRMWGEHTWTKLRIHDGEVMTVVEGGQFEGAMVTSSSSVTQAKLRFVPTLMGQVEVTQLVNGVQSHKSIGPILNQGRSIGFTDSFALISAYESLYDPESVYIAKILANGTVEWRISASQLGLQRGQLQRGKLLNEDAGLVVILGTKSHPTLWERLSRSEHILAAKINISDGSIDWSTTF